jgi:hypothetical protein
VPDSEKSVKIEIEKMDSFQKYLVKSPEKITESGLTQY